MNKLNILIGFLFLLLLIFAPSNCNGITYYKGIRGCST